MFKNFYYLFSLFLSLTLSSSAKENGWDFASGIQLEFCMTDNAATLGINWVGEIFKQQEHGKKFIYLGYKNLLDLETLRSANEMALGFGKQHLSSFPSSQSDILLRTWSLSYFLNQQKISCTYQAGYEKIFDDAPWNSFRLLYNKKRFPSQRAATIQGFKKTLPDNVSLLQKLHCLTASGGYSFKDGFSLNLTDKEGQSLDEIISSFTSSKDQDKFLKKWEKRISEEDDGYEKAGSLVLAFLYDLTLKRSVQKIIEVEREIQRQEAATRLQKSL